jgi:ribokinase
MFDIITFGSATVDIFVDTFDRKKLTPIQKKMNYNHLIAYPVGEKIIAKDLNITIGGGGTNTAVTFQRFGLKTAYCGSLGDDYYGEIIQHFIDQEGIKFIGHKTPKRTSTSIILDSIDHDRTVLTYKGASNYLTFNRIKKNLLCAKIFYFSSLIEDAFETQKKILNVAKKDNIKIAFNPSIYQAKKGKKLWDFLKETEYLILNKEEAQELLENNSPHIKELLKLLQSKLKNKASIVIITDGKNGAYCYFGSEYLRIIPSNVNVIETTGAGDAFASAFVAGMVLDTGIEKSLKLAMANAESVVSNRGAKEVILTLKEAENIVKRRKYEVIKI